MNIVLTHAGLWPWLALVVVPLVIHLFARSRPPAYPHSSVEFILRVVRQTVRIKRPQDWLLLLLRTLLFATLLFLFLMPLLFSGRRLAVPFERRNVVVIVDATASMGATEGAQTRFASACAQAAEILAGLTPRDTANLVWLRARPVAEFPAMGLNVEALRLVLRRAQATSESGNPAEALRLAADLLEGTEGRRVIHVLSDFQKTQWEGAPIAVPPGMELIKIKIGTEAEGNGAVTDVFTDPPRPLVSEEVSLCCEIRNYSARPERRTVYLGVQESRQSREVLVPAWGRATVTFRHRFPAAGIFPVSVSMNEDVFPGDDARWALMEVRAALRIGLSGHDEGVAVAWRRALDAVGWARVEQLADASPDALTPLDAVLLAGDDGAGLSRLDGILAAGATVVWCPGTNMAAGVLSTAFRTGPCGAAVWERARTPYGLRVAAEDDEIFRVFGGGEFGEPAGGSVAARLAIPSEVLPAETVLMRYADGVPALARIDRGGKLFLWNVPLAAGESDVAARMEFVPLFGEMLLRSRARTSPALRQDYLPGERLFWPADGLAEAALELRSADGQPVRLTAGNQTAGSGFLSDEVALPGLFTWESQGRTVGQAVVNFPVVESDLRTMDAGGLGVNGAIGLISAQQVRRLNEGIPLWPWLLATAVIWALLEGVTAWWAGRG